MTRAPVCAAPPDGCLVVGNTGPEIDGTVGNASGCVIRFEQTIAHVLRLGEKAVVVPGSVSESGDM